MSTLYGREGGGGCLFLPLREPPFPLPASLALRFPQFLTVTIERVVSD